MPRPLAVLAVLFLVQFALTSEPAKAAQALDYLTDDLRARVEKLKSDVRETATNPTNQTERARVLWDWTNAFALDGGDLPVNLTAMLTRALVYPERLRGREATLERRRCRQAKIEGRVGAGGERPLCALRRSRERVSAVRRA